MAHVLTSIRELDSHTRKTWNTFVPQSQLPNFARTRGLLDPFLLYPEACARGHERLWDGFCKGCISRGILSIEREILDSVDNPDSLTCAQILLVPIPAPWCRAAGDRAFS